MLSLMERARAEVARETPVFVPGDAYEGDLPPAEPPRTVRADPDADHDFATNADLRTLNLGVRWVWDRWFQDGVVNLLAAEGGLGKTRFMADLCRRLHLGLPWPDGTPTPEHPGKYLAMWVAGDRNQGELLTLSEAFGFGDRICYSGSRADPLGGVTLSTAADFDGLYRKVKAAAPRFVVVDTAGGATTANLSKQEDARAFFAPLSDLAARLSTCVVVITHLNATKTVLGKRAEERVRVVVRMTAEGKEPEVPRRVEVLKSNGLFPKPLGMTLGAAGSEYTPDAPPAPELAGFGRPAAGGKGKGDGEDRAAQKCAAWLAVRLAAAPAKVADLRDLAEAKGFSSKTLYQARDLLGVRDRQDEWKVKWWGLSPAD